MPVTTSQDELMRSLLRVARGLSALFWGLPIALVLSIQTLLTGWTNSIGSIGVLAPPAVHGVLLYGVWLLGYFQRQERIWQVALERVRLFALINVALAPFLHWQQSVPQNEYFSQVIWLLALSGLLFLITLNHVLRRLASMLPDETVRQETRTFASMNINLLCAALTCFAVVMGLEIVRDPPEVLIRLLLMIEFMRPWLFLMLVLIPLAMTMSLLWKTKESIFASVFTSKCEGKTASGKPESC